MLTVYEMNPEGYEEKVFKGNTLEEFIKEVTKYYEDDEVFFRRKDRTS